MTQPSAGTGDHRTEPAVLAQRVADRRAELGMAEQELALAAGMAPRYLRQVLDAGPGFDPGGFVRIAAALGLTYKELLEGRSDPPPGQAGPGAGPVLVHLTSQECWDMVGSHGVGRIALPAEPSPVVFPVNYTVDARTLVYRTALGAPAALDAGSAVSFQVDRVDERLSQGWSVLVAGTTEPVEDPAAVRALAERRAVEPWAGGKRSLWMRIRPGRITGRRIETAPGGHVP